MTAGNFSQNPPFAKQIVEVTISKKRKGPSNDQDGCFWRLGAFFARRRCSCRWRNRHVAKMQPFYTDYTMKSLRSEDEFIKAWKALTDEDRTAMTKSCDEEAANANAANAHPEFCSSVKKNGAGSANN